MPTVYINGVAYQAEDGKNMLQVVLDNKLDLEYFCWHPAMGSVGACRQCAVKSFKDENDTKGKIVMACMTPAVEGTRISLSDPEAMEFRRFVIEWLMINHPHDCPVCDEGGECHLQDMTVMTGHVYRRNKGEKRTYRNQDLGPFVTHEMNRCIQCYRCVRFYRDHAGGRDLDVFASKDHVYFGRKEDGVLESEFSGNLVEVCPTGVFTDKTLSRHYTRKWDLETAPSICPHCSLGCNTIPGERYGKLRRIRSRYNSDVNGYFLCDRGRYGYEFANSEQRIRHCTDKKALQSWEASVVRAKSILQSAKGIIGIGSPRASLESNFALKTLVGEEAFSPGLSAYEHANSQLALELLNVFHAPSLAEVQEADAILVLGCDPTNEAPMLDYSIRQAITIKSRLPASRALKIPDWDARAVFTALQETESRLFTIAPWQIKLEQIAKRFIRTDYAETARIARQMAQDTSSGNSCDEIQSEILRLLLGSDRPLIVTSISAGSDVLHSAAELVKALNDKGKDCKLSIIFPEANSVGAELLGGMSVDDALKLIISKQANTLIVMENDLSRRVGKELLEKAKSSVKHFIALDCIETSTTRMADLVLPAKAWVESDGTFVNNEGRAQRFYQVFVPLGESKSSWEIIREIGAKESWSTFEDVLQDLASERPEMSQVLEAAPSADWRSPADQKIAREPHRATGRTAKNADKSLYEPKPLNDPGTPFAFTMEGEQNPVPGPLEPRFWWPGWNSSQAVTKFQMEVNGPLFESNTGKKLIQPLQKRGLPGQHQSAESSVTSGDMWILPRPHIFGSEELSRLAPGIEQLSPPFDAQINPLLAARIGLTEGNKLKLYREGETIYLPWRFDESLPLNIITVPAGCGIAAPFTMKFEEKSE